MESVNRKLVSSAVLAALVGVASAGELNDWMSQIRDIKVEIAELNSERDGIYSKRDELYSRRDEIYSERDKLYEKRNDLYSERNELHNEVRHARHSGDWGRVRSLESRMDELRVRMDGLHDQINDLSNRAGDLSHQASVLSDQAASLGEGRTDDLSRQVYELAGKVRERYCESDKDYLSIKYSDDMPSLKISCWDTGGVSGFVGVDGGIVFDGGVSDIRVAVTEDGGIVLGGDIGEGMTEIEMCSNPTKSLEQDGVIINTCSANVPISKNWGDGSDRVGFYNGCRVFGRIVNGRGHLTVCGDGPGTSIYSRAVDGGFTTRSDDRTHNYYFGRGR